MKEIGKATNFLEKERNITNQGLFGTKDFTKMENSMDWVLYMQRMVKGCILEDFLWVKSPEWVLILTQKL